MIKYRITNELKKRLAWILTSYNGIENFISYLKESTYIEPNIQFKDVPSAQKLNLFNKLQLLLQFENDILLISPWDIFVDLRQESNSNEIINNSININEPYKIFSIEGNLIYTVKNHLGIFGESRLDKNLVLNSINTSMYFLKYKLFNGQEKVKLIVLNMHSNASLISNTDFKAVPELSISNISIINNSGRSVNVYKTDSNLITNNVPLSYYSNINNLNVINNNNNKTFNVEKSCYFYIEDNDIEINHSKITYPLNNIVFIKNNLEPFFVASNIDIDLINKTFNASIQFNNKPLDDIIIISQSPA